MPAKAAPPTQSETSLQIRVAGLLDKHLAPPAIYTAFPAGGGGHMRGVILKSMGLKAGWPDIQIFWGGRAVYASVVAPGMGVFLLELKTIKGRLSDAQIEMHASIRRTMPGAQIEVARTIEEAKAHFERWGLPRLEQGRSSQIDASKVAAAIAAPADEGWPESTNLRRPRERRTNHG